MKAELTHKLIKAKVYKYQCLFSEEEKKYISQLEIGKMTSFEDKNFFYLLIHVKNNLENKSKENIMNAISNLAFDFEGSSTNKEDKNSNKFPNTFHQEVLYDYLGKNNFILIADIGFGKAAFFANYFIENYKKRQGKWVICVPTELLEQQLIIDLRAEHQEFSKKIGNDIFKNDILILTPEKLFLASSANIKINQIMVDEAHNLLHKNIDRMVFAQKEITKHIGQVEHIYFATSFLSEENQEDFKQIFRELKLECIFINPNNNPKNVTWGETTSDFLTSDENEKNDFKIQEEFDFPTLTHEDNKEKCIYLANKEYHTSKNEPNIYSSSIKNEIEKIEKRFYYKYLPLTWANYGVSYLHRDMPIEVQNMIIELVKKKYIKKIFATDGILNGIDLTFKHVFVNSNEIFKEDMTPLDFNNLNKPSFLEIVEDGMNLFVNMSYQAYKEEKNKIYLLDPRILPTTTKKIKENDFPTLDGWKELVFYRKSADKKELEKFIENLFYTYELYLYDKKFKDKSIPKAYLRQIINATRNYCRNSFNVELALGHYVNSSFLWSKLDNPTRWTENLEGSLSRIKKYGQYFFMMFLSHYISIKSQKKFIEYLPFGTFDDHLIDAIKKTQNEEKWILMVNQTQKHRQKNVQIFSHKWKDCQTLLKEKYLSKEHEFVNEIIAYIK